MKALYDIYIGFVLFIALSAVSCSKPHPASGSQDSRTIQLCTDIPGTKALLDQEAFQKDGNRIMVYDLYTPSGSTQTEQYIKAYAGPDVPSGSPLHEYGTTWAFEDWRNGTPVSYDWTPGGVHKFFGWLAKDANMPAECDSPDKFFTGTLNLNSSYRYEIPQTDMQYDSPQFDFVYSDIVIRDLDNAPDYSPVCLTFNHLFTAFSIGAVNGTDSDITIQEFELVNLYNETSARIDFTGDVVTVEYGEYHKIYTNGSNLFNKVSAPYTLYGGKDAQSDGSNATGNIFEGAMKDRRYSLMWPQLDLAKIHSYKEPYEEDGHTVYPSEWLMYIKYTADGHEVEKRLNFPELAWEAGKRYHFDVTFADKMVDLIVKVSPWNYETQTIDYSDKGVAVTGNHVLIWDPDTYNPSQDPSLHYAYIKNGMPVVGTFQLEAPMGGTWLATLTGDIDAFEIYPESGVIDGGVATINVAPKPEALGLQRDFKVKVKFAVRRTDGRTIAADDVLQPAGTEYTIILSAN